MQVKFNRPNLASLLLALLLSAPAYAEDAQSFNSSIDTRFSLQYLQSKPGAKKDKLHRIAVYKVLDIDKAPTMSQQIMPGDRVEVIYTADKKKAQVKPSSPLPWADIRLDDGMVAVHIPNKYLKLRTNTKIETIWQIDNSDNRLTILKPKISKY